MYTKNDPVGKVIEMMAKLFVFMADEIITECGKEKGGEIVRSAVRKYGIMRATNIKENILNDGKDISFENVELYSDYPPNNAWDCDSCIKNNELWEYTRVCPFSTAFRELGKEEVGKLYCEEIDIALNETFFGNIDFIRPKLFSDGEKSPCEMIVKIID